MEYDEVDVCGVYDGPDEKPQKDEKNKQMENGSCGAPSDQSGSSFCVNLSEISQFFPKTANFKVHDSSHTNSWFLVPERWANARSFLQNKLNYWVKTLKSVEFTDEKDEQIAMRVIHQLAWLLKNSWDGHNESECPSEMLWRARRKENRLDEKLLQDKIAEMKMKDTTNSEISKPENGRRYNEENSEPCSSSSSNHQIEQLGQQHSATTAANNSRQLTQLSINNGILFQMVILQRQWKRILNKMDEFNKETNDSSYKFVRDYVQNLEKKINEFAEIQYALNKFTRIKAIMRETRVLEQMLKRSRYAEIATERILFNRAFTLSLTAKRGNKKKKKKKKKCVSSASDVCSKKNANNDPNRESFNHSAPRSSTHHNPSTNATTAEQSKRQQSLTLSAKITSSRSDSQESSSSLPQSPSKSNSAANADNVDQIRDKTSDELSVTSPNRSTTKSFDEHSCGAHNCEDAMIENDPSLSLYGRGKRISKPKRIDDFDDMGAVSVVKKTIRKPGRSPINGIRCVDKFKKRKTEEENCVNVPEEQQEFGENNELNIPLKKRKCTEDSNAESAADARRCVKKRKAFMGSRRKRCGIRTKCEVVDGDNRMPSTSNQQSKSASLEVETNQENEDCNDSDDDLLDVDDLSDIEDRWLNFCLEDERAKEKQFTELIEPLLKWCNSYRDIVEKAMPKSVAKTRCADRKKKIQRYLSALERLLNNADDDEQMRNRTSPIASVPNDDDDDDFDDTDEECRIKEEN